ncbi:hypothetical protein FB451DRAFT_1273878 [Mycena latifolia]|nr:hypothetical protein FB451DRAFT_1273878 [Mycena latifolia]
MGATTKGGASAISTSWCMGGSTGGGLSLTADLRIPSRMRLRPFSALTGTTSFSLSSPCAASFSRSRCRSRSCSCSSCLSRSRSCATSSSFAQSSFLRACHFLKDALATGGGAGATTSGGDGSRASAAGARTSGESDAALPHAGEGGCTVISDTAFPFGHGGMSGSRPTDTASSSGRTRGGMSNCTSGSSSDSGAGLGSQARVFAAISIASSCSHSSARNSICASRRTMSVTGLTKRMRCSNARNSCSATAPKTVPPAEARVGNGNVEAVGVGRATLSVAGKAHARLRRQ